MRNIRECLLLLVIHIRKETAKPKLYCIALISILYLSALLKPVVAFSRDVGINIAPFAAVFVFSDFNSTFASMMMLLGMACLCSDYPVLDGQHVFCLLRARKTNWICSQVLMLLAIAVVYVLLWTIGSLLPCIANTKWDMQWGKIWNTLALTNAGEAYGLELDVGSSLITNYTPMQALLMSMALKVSVCFFIALCVFAGNMFLSAGLGTLIGFALALEDIFAFNAGIGYWFTWFSPATMSRLVALDQTRTFLFPDFAQAMSIINGLSAILIALIIIRGRKKAV